MKRELVSLLKWVFAALAFFAGLVWINNISVLVQWIIVQWRSPEPVNFQSNGIIPLLGVLCKDLSTISTLIPFYTFFFFARGYHRMLKGETLRTSKDFPLFDHYITITGILGLIGTVFGIIIVTLYSPARDSVDDMSSGIGTALWSTEVAFVFIVIKLVFCPVFDIMNRSLNGQPGSKRPSSARRVFDELGAAAEQTTGHLTKTTAAVALLEGQATGCGQALNKMGTYATQSAEQIKTLVDTANKGQKSMRLAIAELRKKARQDEAENKRLRKELDAERQKKADELERTRQERDAARNQAAEQRARADRAEATLSEIRRKVN